MPRIRILPALTSLILVVTANGPAMSAAPGSQSASSVDRIELACSSQLRMRKRRQKAREKHKQENTYAPGQNSRIPA